jgi:hypothetical protein
VLTEERIGVSSADANLFDGLNNDEVESLDKTCLTLIERIDPRIWYAETRRSTFANLAVFLLGAGTALLTAVAVNHVRYRPAFWGLLFLALGAIGAGGLVLLVYSAQTNFDYPFKKKTSTWKWFYRDALPKTKTLPVPWYAMQSSAAKSAAEASFDEDWQYFVEQSRKLVDVRVNAQQDLQQLYVLHVNEFYKNKFLTQIRRVTSWGFVAAITIGVVAFLIALGVSCG